MAFLELIDPRNWNLAAWKYRNIKCEDGGPVSDVYVAYLEAAGVYEVSVKLDEKIFQQANLGPRAVPAFYGNSDGTGTDRYSNVAEYKAISEALERWAFFSTHSNNSNTHGIDVDPSTNGFAAFPSYSPKEARKRSVAEAIERWALVHWWSGQLACKALNMPLPRAGWCTNQIQGISLDVPFNAVKVVVLYTAIQNGIAYGFAARSTLASAAAAACVELERNCWALQRTETLPGKQKPDLLYEKRLLYFSRPKGYEEFQERIKQSSECRMGTIAPKLLFDNEVAGPWSQYARVWRCVFSGMEKHVRDERIDLFLF